jgi:hypothetical protein
MTNKQDIKRFDDGDQWLELRVGGLSKGESDLLTDVQTSMNLNTIDGVVRPGDAQKIEINRRIADANQALFDILCINWSLDVDPSAEAYADLDEESGQWVDECIGKVLEERRKRAEGNGSAVSSRRRSSAKPKRSAAASKTTVE